MGETKKELDSISVAELIGENRKAFEVYFEAIQNPKGRIVHSQHYSRVAAKDPIAMKIEAIISNYGLSLKTIKQLLTYPEIETIYFKCPVCGSEMTGNKVWIRSTCSNKCSGKFSQNKAQETCLKKYGVSSPLQAKGIQEKSKQTFLKKYGVDTPLRLAEKREMGKKTMLEKYGVENCQQSEEIRERTKQTNLKKYGVEHAFQAESVKEKIRETLLERYGVDNPFKNGPFRDKQMAAYRKKRFDLFSKILDLRKIEMLTPYEEHLTAKMLKFRCQKCDIEFESIYSSGSQCTIWCPECHTYRSEGENQLEDFLRELLPGEEIRRNSKKVLPDGREIDLYVPSRKFAIEFDGIFWHSSENKSKRYHLSKTRACEKLGIRLIHIFENEWVHQMEKVKALIKSRLGIFDQTIAARKCRIIDLTDSNVIYYMFLEENHLQGYVPTKIRLGLLYGNDLVAVAGFGKSRFTKDETELIRFCTKMGVRVIGGLSKLIKHSGVTNLISYVDRRYFDGSGYKKIGFELIKETDPSYVYCKNNSPTLSRYQCQKHKLPELLGDKFDPDRSESENMALAGYLQVFDCGTLKFQLKKS